MSDLKIDHGRQAAAAGTEPVIAPASDAAYVEKVRGAAEKFEAFFIAQLLRQMREGTRAMADEESIFNSRSAQEMLDMADVALADSLAGQRAFGIADVIVRQLLPSAAQPTFKTSSAPAASSDR
jgi:flagellar protein FlgJ